MLLFQVKSIPPDRAIDNFAVEAKKQTRLLVTDRKLVPFASPPNQYLTWSMQSALNLSLLGQRSNNCLQC